MYNVPEYTVLILPTGHGNKQALVALNYLDVMDCQHVVDGDRDNGTQPSLCDDPSDLDICDFHKMTSSFAAHLISLLST